MVILTYPHAAHRPRQKLACVKVLLKDFKPLRIILLLGFCLLVASGCSGGGNNGGGNNGGDIILDNEIIPTERRIDWYPGVPGGIPNYPVCFNVTDAPYNAQGDGIVDDTTAIQAAIDDCPEGQAVFIPEGTYRTTAQLTIQSSIVLRGDGPDRSKITLDTPDTANIIRIYQPSNYGPDINIISGYTKGSTSITVADSSTVTAGDYIIVSQLNKSGLVTNTGYGSPCTWCGLDNGARAMTQIVQVADKNGDVLTISRPLYFTFEENLDPEIRETAMLEGAGIEDLTVEQIDSGGAYAGSDSIRITSGAKCWVKNVESYNSVGAHVKLENSYACEIRDSYFHEGHNYASGRVYGVFLMGRNSDHLIENNIIYKTRHAMIFEGGGSGNVFGYNFADDGYSLPDTEFLTTDASTHGSHPYMNLFEGNIHDKIGHDNTFGSSSHNTHLRNHVDRNAAGITRGLWAVDIQSNNYYENLVGNVLCEEGCIGTVNYGDSGSRVAIYKLGYDTPGDDSGPDDPQVERTLLRHGNFDYVNNSTLWDPNISNQNLPNSYYLTSKPSFFGSLPWPAIGPELSPMVGTIPAKQRFDEITSGP